MDFAKKILGKYGWKDGDGLGKNNDGMSKPLKAYLKFDNAGFGADQAASDFNNHWWERVFNEASSNVAIKSDENGVSMDLKNPNESVEITTKSYSVRKLKERKNNEKYENFLQSATLTKSGDEIEKPDRITATEIEVQQFKQLTDDELFKACGGRTAHKGARHGLKLSGKLARLQQQEQEMLANILAKKNGGAAGDQPFNNEIKHTEEDNVSRDKKKKCKKSKTKREKEPTELMPEEAVPASAEKNDDECKALLEPLSNQLLQPEPNLVTEEIERTEKKKKHKKTKRKSKEKPAELIPEETIDTKGYGKDEAEALDKPLSNQIKHTEYCLETEGVDSAEKKKKCKKSKRKSNEEPAVQVPEDLKPKKKRAKK